jgi:phosphoserine aminotransferase
MMQTPQPAVRPANPRFSSGPCTKRPGWTFQKLDNAFLGRSHRAKDGKARLKLAIDKTRAILGVPEDYRIGIVPASDTGAVEMAMWTMLGARPVTMLAWESFGSGWVTDAVKQLKLDDCEIIEAAYGALPDLTTIDTTNRDIVFTWNGTTSGVRVPDADWIDPDREGITICDATSAVFAQDLNWARLDVTTFSWQKVMGGEAAHGMIILSPHAVERLEKFTPDRPLPKVFRLTKGGRLIEGIFRGETINTPSMLCVEDYLDALAWAEGLGGLDALIGRADANLAVLAGWVEHTPWIDFLASAPATRSNTSVCLSFTDPAITALDGDAQATFAKAVAGRLDVEGVAYDIGSYRDAPPGLRIWAGATVEADDLEALTAWIDWAYEAEKAALAAG